jgi:NADH-ubiquinone oxidoreductase chain 4
MAAPPTLNLLGEIFLINRLISFRSYTVVLLRLISFIRAAYSLFLFSYIQHGKNYSGFYRLNLGLIREYLTLFLH